MEPEDVSHDLDVECKKDRDSGWTCDWEGWTEDGETISGTEDGIQSVLITDEVRVNGMNMSHRQLNLGTIGQVDASVRGNKFYINEF